MVREGHWHRVKYHLGLIQLPIKIIKNTPNSYSRWNILDNRLLHRVEVLQSEYPLEGH